jgi:hypothetical protein
MFMSPFVPHFPRTLNESVRIRHCLRFEVSPEELQRRVCSVLGAEKVLGRAMEIDGTPVLEIVKKEYLGISRILR